MNPRHIPMTEERKARIAKLIAEESAHTRPACTLGGGSKAPRLSGLDYHVNVASTKE